MNEQYLLFIENFKEHLKQLALCDEKVLNLSKKTKELTLNYEKDLNKIDDELSLLFSDFKNSIDDITIDKIESAAIKTTLLREQNNFFITSFDVLATGENELKKQVKTNISKLNLLLEAALKLKFFICDRKEKLIAKHPDEDHKELIDIATKSVSLADKVNVEVSKLNAKIAFMFANELELSSRLQTLEAIISELKKRYSNLS